MCNCHGDDGRRKLQSQRRVQRRYQERIQWYGISTLLYYPSSRANIEPDWNVYYVGGRQYFTDDRIGPFSVTFSQKDGGGEGLTNPILQLEYVNSDLEFDVGKLSSHVLQPISPLRVRNLQGIRSRILSESRTLLSGRQARLREGHHATELRQRTFHLRVRRHGQQLHLGQPL